MNWSDLNQYDQAAARRLVEGYLIARQAHQAAARIRGALEAYDAATTGKVEEIALHAFEVACSPDSLRALLAERDELAKDAARWRLVAGHWKNASLRWKKEPNVPKSITITVDFGVVAAEADQIEGFIDAARAALTNKD